MRPAGYNTSKYTKQDPNDHFGAAFKCLAMIIGIIVAIGGLPVGLGLLIDHTSCHAEPCFIMVMAITFGVEGAVLIVVLCYGMYLRARHEADIEIGKVTDIETGDMPTEGDYVEEETLGMEKRADGEGFGSDALTGDEAKKKKSKRKSTANGQLPRKSAAADAPRKSRAAKDDLITQGPWAVKSKAKSQIGMG